MTKILVAYFSASGETKKVAKKIAQATKADLYEIQPETPYSEADLNWHDSKSRSSIEMKEHPEFRPAISNRVAHMETYETIFIGFPIWWYIAPTIINTFLESYDFSNKKIVLFATSGMSGMGKTMEILKPSADHAVFIGEKRLEVYISQEEVNEWIKNLNI